MQIISPPVNTDLISDIIHKYWPLMHLHFNSRNFVYIMMRRIKKNNFHLCEVSHLRGEGRGGVLYSQADQVAALFLLHVLLDYAKKACWTELENMGSTLQLLSNIKWSLHFFFQKNCGLIQNCHFATKNRNGGKIAHSDA